MTADIGADLTLLEEDELDPKRLPSSGCRFELAHYIPAEGKWAWRVRSSKVGGLHRNMRERHRELPAVFDRYLCRCVYRGKNVTEEQVAKYHPHRVIGEP
jgi:hypothetical protein